MTIAVITGTSNAKEDVANAIIWSKVTDEIVYVHDRHAGALAHKIDWRALFHMVNQMNPTLVIGLFSCGSLPGSDILPGTVVRPVDFIDYSGGHGTEDIWEHVPMAYPFAQGIIDWEVTDTVPVTLANISGPRFSTPAESVKFAADGCDVVNMTQAAEATWAAALGIPYISIGLVTDGDASEAVNMTLIHERALAFAENQRNVLLQVLSQLK